MTSINIFSSHLQKLGHPIKEIRERALNQLLAKLKYGFKFDDDLARTRELLQVLFQWFTYENPSFQMEVLSLVMFALKSDAGNALIRDIGVADIMRNLDDIKEKVNTDSEELFNKILDTVRFLSILQSAEGENIPKLDIPQSICSFKSDQAPQQSDNNIFSGILSITDGDLDISDTAFDDRNNFMQNCVRVLLLPWIQPCKSDLKTLSLIEDTLQIVKSTKKCCRFLKDVLIKDFPPDIFFNRPLIVKKLQTMVGVQGRIVDVLEVLLSITVSANNRIDQLLDVSMCNSKLKIHTGEKTVQSAHVEDVERIISGTHKTDCAINGVEDNVAPLNQLPVPYFCLDTMYEVVLSLGRNVIIISSGDNEDIFGMEEINVAFSLLNELTMLLFKCVDKTVWVVDHNKKILKDIVQKSFMVMRESGELLNKYCASFSADNNKVHHRLAYLRLIPICLNFMKWAEATPLLPNSICTGLQNALSDVVLSYTHPLICSELVKTFQSITSMVNKDYSKKYTEILKTCQSIQSASCLIKTPDKYKDNFDVIDIIKKSLPVLELHNSRSYLKFVMKIFILKLHTWCLEEEKMFVVRKILLSFLASHIQWVQIEVYRTISATVINVLTKGSKSDHNGLNEESLQFLMDPNIMTEILCHGLSSSIPAVKSHASDIILYLIRGKLVLSEKIWMLFLQSFLPVLPLLHSYAAHEDVLGNAIIKSLDLNIAECMQLPKTEIINGNVRLLFVKCYSAQMEGANNLCAILNADDSDTQLPPASAIRPDLLITIVRRVKPMKFNICARPAEEQETQPDVGLIQVLDLLKNGLRLDESYIESVTDLNDISTSIEPAFRRSTLQQLAVLMQQPTLHNSFLECNGLQLVYVHLRLSLLGEDYAVFVECCKSCISILNSVLSTSGVARQTMLKKCGLCLLILRAVLHFPNDDSLVMLASQTLFLLIFSSYLLQDLSSDGGLSLPHCIVSRTNVPFECSSYWKTSNHKTHSLLDLILEDDVYKSFLRFNWSVSWYGSIDNIAKWPYVPEKNEMEDFASFLHVTDKDLALLKMTHPLEGTKIALYKVQNSTTHKSVDWALSLLTGYALVTSQGNSNLDDYYSLPWSQTFSRYIASTPASPNDVLLLIRVLKFMLVYVECALQHDTRSSGEAVNWIINSLTDKNFTMFSVLLKKNLYPEQNASDYNDITLLQSYIVKVLLYCVLYCECYGVDKIQRNSDRWLSVLNTFLTCLNGLDLTNFEILGYIGEIVKCIRYLVQSDLFDLPKEMVLPAVKVLIKVAHTCPQGQNDYDGFKGQGVLFNLLIALSGFSRVMHRLDLSAENWTNTWFENKEKTLLMLIACCKCDRVELRTAAFHLIVSLTNNPLNILHLDEGISAFDDGVLEFSTKVLVDVTEASIVREQAAKILLNIIMARNPGHNMEYTLETFHGILKLVKPKFALRKYSTDHSITIRAAERSGKKIREPGEPIDRKKNLPNSSK